jgi:starch phosphorylase
MYYDERSGDNLPVEWIARMKESMRSMVPQFCTRRMVKEYMNEMYFPAIQSSQLKEKTTKETPKKVKV